MQQRSKFLFLFVGAALFTGFARAGVTVNALRFGVQDLAVAEKFYQQAFGFRVVNRIDVGDGHGNGRQVHEVFLNVGTTLAEAKSSTATQIILEQRQAPVSDGKAAPASDGPVPLILSVTDMSATTAAVKAAGGTVKVEPRQFANDGITMAMVVDPSGNVIELLQFPANKSGP